jgi:hypothetical protein
MKKKYIERNDKIMRGSKSVGIGDVRSSGTAGMKV